jgi:hypothetical protein
MTTRYDVITGRKAKDGKTYWTKIGSMWPSERGGFQITFDALPLTDSEGRCSALVVEPKPRDEAPARSQEGRRAPSNDMDDTIPFGMEWR